jgi:hypothetical protein
VAPLLEQLRWSKAAISAGRTADLLLFRDRSLSGPLFTTARPFDENAISSDSRKLFLQSRTALAGVSAFWSCPAEAGSTIAASAGILMVLWQDHPGRSEVRRG